MIHTTSWNEMLKDMYPLPGTRIKQWVLDRMDEAAWVRETCPRIHRPAHDDNTGMSCRNFGPVPWAHLDHDSCYPCNDAMEAHENDAAIVAWLAERDARAPIEADQSKYSDEAAK